MQLLNVSSKHNGHIPRNVRLSLMSIDMVQPYVCIKHVALSRRRSDTDCGQTGNATTHQLEQDVACRLASTHSNGSTYEERRMLSESPSAAAVMSPIEVVWYAGGSSTVDCTFLSWHVLDDAQAPTTIDWTAYLDSLHLQSPHAMGVFRAFCSRNDSKDAGPLTFPLLATTAPQRGASRWSNNATLLSSNSSAPIDNPSQLFTSSPVLPIYNSKLFPPGRYWLVAWAMTDQHYGAPHQGYPVDRSPQSHLANVRTNVHWYKQVNSRVARGTLFWPSDPIEVIVSEGGYVVRSVTVDCAWWDRDQSSDDAQTLLFQESSRALPIHTASSTIPERNPTDSSTPPTNVFHRPIFMRDSWTEAFKVLTGALVLIILLVCCALRMGTQWRHKNRFFSSITTTNNNRPFSNPRFAR